MRLYTPLRYPGGKGKIYEDIKKLIVGNSLESKTYVEPFAGSFAIGIGLLSDGIVEKAILNDYDYHIYAFWRSVFFKTNDLIKNVIDLPITVEEWKRQKVKY